MTKNLAKEKMIVDNISTLIKPEYLNHAALVLQENVDSKDSILIKLENNPWRNGVIKGDLLFGRIKTGGKIEYLQVKKSYSDYFNNMNISYSSNKTELNEDMIRINLSDICAMLDDPTELFVQTINTIYINNISFTPFGCCSKYSECQKEGKCLHTDQLYATACQWRKHLKGSETFEGIEKETSI